jgi:hypothetical protein
VRRTAAVGLALFLVLQLVPYGWTHSNPEVTGDATWPDAQSEELARGACYDCHSNETDWPAYAYVAPMSWLVRRDVDAGRRALNLSELDQGGCDELDDAAEAIEDGTMPPRQYRLLHPAARLSAAERARLAAAFDQVADAEDERADDRRGSSSGPGRAAHQPRP